MQLAAPVTLQASTDIVDSCQTACCCRKQEYQHAVPHGAHVEKAGLLRAKRQTGLPLLSLLLSLQVIVTPEMLLLRSAWAHPKLQHCLADILEPLPVAHVFVLAVLQIWSVIVKLHLYVRLCRR